MNGEEVRIDAKEKDKSSGMLTADEVLTTIGFEHFTREEAEEYIQSMIQFCVIMYSIYSVVEKAAEKEELIITNKAA